MKYKEKKEPYFKKSHKETVKGKLQPTTFLNQKCHTRGRELGLLHTNRHKIETLVLKSACIKQDRCGRID